MGFIKTLFSTLIGIIVAVLTFPAKLLPFGKSKSKTVAPAAATEAKTGEAFFLEGNEATGVASAPTPAKGKASKTSKTKTSKTPKTKTSKTATVPAAATALNLPQPTVTASPEMTYSSFAPRRRPGANMKSYLDMAKSMKNA